MTRAQALAKLKKILGDTAALKVNTQALDAAGRAQARAELGPVLARCAEIKDAEDARVVELLKNDAEFQRLKTERIGLDAVRDSLQGKALMQRYTAGRMNSLFFMVEAEGDTLDEMIATLAKKKGAK